MGMSDSFALIAFDSTHNAIRAEKFLLAADFKINIIPVPTEITAGCGLSIKIRPEDLSDAANILERDGVPASGFYQIELNGFKKTVTKMEVF